MLPAIWLYNLKIQAAAWQKIYADWALALWGFK